MARRSYRRQGRTLYVGDSLGVGTAPNLTGVKANVRGGRPSSEGLQVVKRRGKSFDRIVFDLGTNDGSVQNLKQSVRGLQRVAKGKEITMATIHGPDAKRKNAYLKRLARRGKINLVNTSGVQLAGDGIHATAKGYKQRAKLVNRALGETTKRRKPRPKPVVANQHIAPQYIRSTTTPPKPQRRINVEAELRKILGPS